MNSQGIHKMSPRYSPAWWSNVNDFLWTAGHKRKNVCLSTNVSTEDVSKIQSLFYFPSLVKQRKSQSEVVTRNFVLMRISRTTFEQHFFRHKIISFTLSTYLIKQNVFITERAIDMSHKVTIRPRRIIHDGFCGFLVASSRTSGSLADYFNIQTAA